MERLTARQLAGLLNLDHSSAVDEAEFLRGLGLIEFVYGSGYSLIAYRLTARGQAHIDAVLAMPLPEWEPGRWRTGYYELWPGTSSNQDEKE